MSIVTDADKILYEYCNDVICEHVNILGDIQMGIEYNVEEKDNFYYIACVSDVIFIDKKIFMKYITKYYSTNKNTTFIENDNIN